MSASEGSLSSLAIAPDFFAARGVAFAGAGFFFGAGFAEAAFAFVPAFFAADFFGWDAATGEEEISSAGDSDGVFDFFGTGIGICRNRSSVSDSFARRFSAIQERAVRRFAYDMRVRHFLFRWVVTTIAVALAAWLVHGISVDGTSASIGAALLLGIFNAFVRPVLLLLSAPLILISLGLFILVINALLLMVVPTFVPGFHVNGFGSAFWGALIISTVSWLLSAFFRGSDGRVHVLTHHAQVKRVHGRVIEPNEEAGA